jgi:hypothetical protein
MSDFFSSSSSKPSKCEEIICKESNPYSKYQKYASIFEQNEENQEEAFKTVEKSKKEKESSNYYRTCPNDKQSLGFFTWNYLHTMAIYYPTHPNEKEKKTMKNFIEGIAMFYPCKVCAIDFQKNIKISKDCMFYKKMVIKIHIFKYYNCI